MANREPLHVQPSSTNGMQTDQLQRCILSDHSSFQPMNVGSHDSNDRLDSCSIHLSGARIHNRENEEEFKQAEDDNDFTISEIIWTNTSYRCCNTSTTPQDGGIERIFETGNTGKILFFSETTSSVGSQSLNIFDTPSDSEIRKSIELRRLDSTEIDVLDDDHAAVSRIPGLDDWRRREVKWIELLHQFALKDVVIDVILEKLGCPAKSWKTV